MINLNKTKTLRIISILLLFFALSITIAGCGNNNEKVETIIKKKVTVQPIVKQTEVVSSLLASGTVTPKEHSVIRALTPGTIEYLTPLGLEVLVGQPLFSIRDFNIESAYFNALQSREQTSLITDQRIQQAELGLNSTQARLKLAQSQYDKTVLQTEQNLRTAEDSAVIAYNSAYNSVNQYLNYLSSVSIKNEHATYKYKDILTGYSQLRIDTTSLYTTVRLSFLNLSYPGSKNNLVVELNKLQTTISLNKQLIDDTSILLQTAVSGLETDKIIIAGYQTGINQHVGGVISAINSLNNTEIGNRLTLDQAQGQLTLAQIDYDNSSISLQSAKDSAILERGISQTQFNNAAYNYNNLSLAAPFSGTILSHFVSAGQQISSGQELIEIGNLTIIEVPVDVDAELAKAIKLGDKVIIDNNYNGFVSAIEPVGDLTSGKVRVIVQSEQAHDLTAGSIAEVEFTLTYPQTEGVIVVPIKSVIIEASANYVFVVEDNKVVRKNVSLGGVFGDQIIVTEGLTENDNLILLNGIFIAAGDEVEMETK